jgi:hypothetical protein
VFSLRKEKHNAPPQLTTDCSYWWTIKNYFEVIESKIGGLRLERIMFQKNLKKYEVKVQTEKFRV